MAFQLALGCESGVHRTCDCCVQLPCFNNCQEPDSIVIALSGGTYCPGVITIPASDLVTGISGGPCLKFLFSNILPQYTIPGFGLKYFSGTQQLEIGVLGTRRYTFEFIEDISGDRRTSTYTIVRSASQGCYSGPIIVSLVSQATTGSPSVQANFCTHPSTILVNFCGSGCASNTEALARILAQTGLTTVSAFGGPVVSTPTSDYKKLTCPPLYPDGSNDPDYPAFDFSPITSSLITTTPSGAGYVVCPPNFAPGEDPRGSLESFCGLNFLNSRGFAYRTRIFGDGSCPSYLGPNTLDHFASFRATVVFACESGASKYNLYVNTSLILYTQNPTGHFASLPLTGIDWTRADGVGQSVFTRNGSDSNVGAAVGVSFIRNIPSGTVYEVTASAWTVSPNTFVSMWVPNPVIDWTGLTHTGTAFLS